MEQAANRSSTDAHANPAEARRYFTSLGVLRFLAFFLVFLHHLPIVEFSWFNFISNGGGLGVQFFFVLSGFLITYIIGNDKFKKGNFNLRNFFMRRILRIWPLFYLIVAFAYILPVIITKVTGPHPAPGGYEPNLIASVLFLENYRIMLYHRLPASDTLAPLWSLCVEEHFYILWGLALYFLPFRRLPVLFAAGIVLGVIARCIYVHFNLSTNDIFTNIDLFAYGAVPAYLLVVKPEKTESFIARIPTPAKGIFILVVIMATLLCSQIKTDRGFIFASSLMGCLYSGIIALTLPRGVSFRVTKQNILFKMSTYSYGLYVYHMPVLFFLGKIFRVMNWGLDRVGFALLFGVAAFAITLTISMLSYRFYELPFLRLKAKFKS